jgi:hypothetical protein
VITFRAIPGGTIFDGWCVECSPPGLQPFVWSSFATQSEAEAEAAKLMEQEHVQGPRRA